MVGTFNNTYLQLYHLDWPGINVAVQSQSFLSIHGGATRNVRFASMSYGKTFGANGCGWNVGESQALKISLRLVGEHPEWIDDELIRNFGACSLGLKTASCQFYWVKNEASLIDINFQAAFRAAKNLPGSLCSCGSCHCIMLAVSSGGFVGWWKTED